MNATLTTTALPTAVILSSYNWDDTLHDDNRAWYTEYSLYLPETKELTHYQEPTGFGVRMLRENYNIIPMTDEIREQMMVVQEHNYEVRTKADFEKYSEEVEAYNASLRPQEKGQMVEIMAGRRKGKIARISWIGKGKSFGFDSSAWYRRAYPRAAMLLDCAAARPYSIPMKDADLIRVWPTDGTDPFYISIDKVKVVEGFKPISITYEDCYNFGRSFKDSLSRKLNNGYNCYSAI